jgi:hypothetical protein
MRLAEAQLGRFAEALGAHLGEIDGGAQREQALVRANIARGFFAADMLLASLQREDPAAAAAAINSLARNATGHAADELLFAGHDAEVRTSIEERRAERLPFSDGHIGAQVAGPLQQTEADWIERLNQQRAGVVGDFRNRCDVLQAAEEVRMLQQDAGRVAIDGGGDIGGLDHAAGRRDGD